MKPSIPKGTRDFTPEEVARRQYIFSTIRDVFERYGFLPVETPVMENLATLTGKYGEEGDKLLFKVLNNGDFLAKADEQALNQRNSSALVSSIARRGLRYDLTVPFARFIVMHRNDIQLPFKRYQIQPVWRADRPQKGRYQEFYQCDADAIGSDSLMYEAEFVQMIDEVFSRLKLDVEILINNRKILAGIAEVAGVSDQMMDMTIAIDKLDKIGWDGVIRDLQQRGFTEDQIETIHKIFSANDIEEVRTSLQPSAIGRKGLEEIDEVMGFLEERQSAFELKVEITLARGLNYYTGCIFEVRSREVEMGSILGGGRYDDLTSVFGMPDVSGVGISFGVERIYDILLELERFPSSLAQSLDVLFVAMDPASHKHAFGLVTQMRQHGFCVDLYPEASKMKKMMRYADQRNVPYVIIVGSEEVVSKQYSLKHMTSGDQWTLNLEQIMAKLKA